MAAIPVAIFSTLLIDDSMGSCPEARLIYQDGSNTGLKLTIVVMNYDDTSDLWTKLQELDPEASEGSIMGIFSWSAEKIVMGSSFDEGDMIAEIPATNANLSSFRQALQDLRTQFPEPFYNQCSQCHGYRQWLEQRYQKQLKHYAEWDYRYLADRRVWLALSDEEQEECNRRCAALCRHAVSADPPYKCIFCNGFRSYKREKKAIGQSLPAIRKSWHELLRTPTEQEILLSYRQQDRSTCPHTQVQLAQERNGPPLEEDADSGLDIIDSGDND